MKSILIVRPDAIGDFVIFSAVLEGYEKLFKEYKIDLLCHPKVKELVRGIPFINKRIYINSMKLFRKRYFIYTIFSILKLFTLKYDKIIYPVYSRTKNFDLIASFIRAEKKIAFDGDNSNDPKNERFKRNKFFTKIVESEKGEKLELMRNIEFIHKLGVDVDVVNAQPKIWFLEKDDIEYKLMRQTHKFDKDNYITIFPGAGYPIKLWEEKKWSELIKRITEEYPKCKIVILGYGSDIITINKILKILNTCHIKNLINLYQQISLRVLAKVIQNSKLLIGMDTGAIHIAAALNTPNICLMGGGHFGRFYPYGDLNKNRIVYEKLDCFGCNWKCSYGVAKCIKEIKVEKVWKEIKLLWGDKR